MMITNMLLVLVGGGLGAVCRYFISLLTLRWFGNGFTWGTLSVNLGGCLLIGIAFALTERAILGQPMRLFFMTGFLGGLTTFSSYALETIVLWKGSELALGIANIALNNLGGLLLVLLGIWLGRRL
jgi:CrcB protein